jgi:hypothetical protein
VTRAEVRSTPFIRTATAKPAAAQGDIALKRAEQALRGLAALKRKIQDVDRRLGADIVGPFSPWFGGVWKEAQPRALLFYIVKDTRTNLKKSAADYGDDADRRRGEGDSEESADIGI